MKILIIVIIAFLVPVYVYTYIKYKKRKKNQLSTVDSYRKNYLERIAAKNNQRLENVSSDELQKQITKYNSSVDYIEWNDFVSEVNEQKEASKPQTVKPKRLQY